MVTLTLFPTVKNDLCTHWHDADTGSVNCLNILDKVVDADCVHHHVHITGNHDLALLTYRDAAGNVPAIPVGSTITDVVLYIHGLRPNDIRIDLNYSLTIGVNTYGFSSRVALAVPFVCAACLENHFHFGAVLTVAEVNAESYTTLLRATYADGHGVTVNVEADLVWLEIIYTLPPSGLIQLPKMGVGLMLKLEARLPRLPPFLLENLFHRGKAKSKLHMRTIG